MKKYILIICIAVLTLSCSDMPETDNSAVQQAKSETEQVESSNVNSQGGLVEYRNNLDNSKTESRSISVFLYLIVFLNVLATAFALLYAFFISGKVTRANLRIDQRKRDIAGLNSDITLLRQEIDRLKHQTKSSSSYQSPYTPQTNVPQTPTKPIQNAGENPAQKKEDNKKPKQQVPKQPTRSTKVLYLEANSDECFFQFYEQKRDTSKFVAQVIPGDMVATFEVIDVERIRSLNTSRSIKQAGNVAIKDAQGIIKQQAGKIHKTKDANGTDYWVIDEPVTVEFKK